MGMEWVKSKVDYYRHLGIATGTDAMEVMFKRGDALAGEIGQGGFIPDALLTQLTRRPGTAKKTAAQLVKTGLWQKVRGGYLIADFEEINAELVRLTERKARDRSRKRAERAAVRDGDDPEMSDAESTDASVDMSADASTDGHVDSLYDSERKTKNQTAAAAAAAPDVIDQHRAAAEILADKLRAHTALAGIRTDLLTVDQAAELVALVERHGDTRLVDQALKTLRRDDPPRLIQAFLGTWRAMPAPGERLAVVPEPPCTEPGHTGTARHCTQCASERKAAR